MNKGVFRCCPARAQGPCRCLVLETFGQMGSPMWLASVKSEESPLSMPRVVEALYSFHNESTHYTLTFKANSPVLWVRQAWFVIRAASMVTILYITPLLFEPYYFQWKPYLPITNMIAFVSNTHVYSCVHSYILPGIWRWSRNFNYNDGFYVISRSWLGSGLFTVTYVVNSRSRIHLHICIFFSLL